MMSFYTFINTSSRNVHKASHALRMCAGSVLYLVKQWAVCNRKSKGVKTHAQYHVVRSIVTVAFTAACQESHYSFPAEHHPITQGQRVKENHLTPG